MSFIKKNFTLIIGASIPIVMIILVIASIYLPRFFIQPKYNFLYATGNDNKYYKQYSIENGTLIKNDIGPEKDIKLYLFNVKENKSAEISFEQARRLDIDSNNISMDGFEVVHGNHGNGYFLFFFNAIDHNTYYIKGHNFSEKLNLQLSGRYNNNFCFIGWIK